MLQGLNGWAWQTKQQRVAVAPTLCTTYTGYFATHTHPFNGPLYRTTWVSRYQKGKTNLDFTEARDSEWQWHRLGHMLVCTSLQTDNHASTPPLSFLQAGCPSCRPTNSVKALKAQQVTLQIGHKMNQLDFDIWENGNFKQDFWQQLSLLYLQLAWNNKPKNRHKKQINWH